MFIESNYLEDLFFSLFFMISVFIMQTNINNKIVSLKLFYLSQKIKVSKTLGYFQSFLERNCLRN